MRHFERNVHGDRRQAQFTLNFAKSSVTSDMPRTVTLTHSHGLHRTWAWDDHPSASMYHPKINRSAWKGVRSIQSAQMSIQSSICDQYSYMRIHLLPNYTTQASQLRSKPLIFPRQLKQRVDRGGNTLEGPDNEVNTPRSPLPTCLDQGTQPSLDFLDQVPYGRFVFPNRRRWSWLDGQDRIVRK